MKDAERKWGIPLTTVQQMRLMTAPHIICCCCRIPIPAVRIEGGFFFCCQHRCCATQTIVCIHYKLSCNKYADSLHIIYPVLCWSPTEYNNKQKTPKLFIDEEETILNEHFPFFFFYFPVFVRFLFLLLYERNGH